MSSENGLALGFLVFVDTSRSCSGTPTQHKGTTIRTRRQFLPEWQKFDIYTIALRKEISAAPQTWPIKMLNSTARNFREQPNRSTISITSRCQGTSHRDPRVSRASQSSEAHKIVIHLQAFSRVFENVKKKVSSGSQKAKSGLNTKDPAYHPTNDGL